MLFRSETTPKTWDGWVYYHEGTYYLYYLISERFVSDGFAVATSPDGVHWTDRGWVLRHADEMVRYLGTGSVWKDASQGQARRFICNYSEWRMEEGTNVQRILFARSTDLVHWTKLGDDRAFTIDERFYKRIEPAARGPWEDPRWDGMCVVPRPEGGYHGYWTATPKDLLGFGFGASADGVRWEALPPPAIDWGDTPQMYFIEVGGVQQIDGRYHAMLADYATVHCGMFQFVADDPAGPFRPASRNYCLMGNQSKMHAYFTRFLDSPHGVLVNHHSLAEGQASDDHFVVYYAPFKKAHIIDGTLYLAWWPGNDRLKQGEGVPCPSAEPIRFDADRGLVLEGQMTLPGRLVIGTDGEAGIGIQANEQAIVEIGPLGTDGSAFMCEERIDREVDFGPRPRFRLLLYHTMLEFYLDDIFIQCYTMDQAPNGTLAYQNADRLRLWQW